MTTDSIYHIYVNERCFRHNLSEEQFNKEYTYIKAFLELTNLMGSAKIEYEQCEIPQYSHIDDPSYWSTY